MTRMTGPDCVVMCNLINTYIHTVFSGVPSWRLIYVYSITVGFSPVLYCDPMLLPSENPFICHEEVLNVNVLTFFAP